MQIDPLRTASLGDTTYLLYHEGVVVVVDPQRDLERFLDGVDPAARVSHVLETHVHNDYISGGLDLARRTGGDLVMPAGSGAGFAFVPAFHLEDIEVSSVLRIRPIHTPGHTPEHVSYVVVLEDRPVAVFTGGSLLVGAAGRSDLLGDAYATQLAHLQYESLLRLAELPDAVKVYPTHGEGSFCTASGAGRSGSTIGEEKAANPAYRFADAVSFAKSQLSGLTPYPAYYRYMAPINRTNPTALEPADVEEMGPDRLAELVVDAAVLDGRPRHDFAAGHVPGSIGIELGSSFAPWAGWLFAFNRPLLLVLNRDQDAGEAAVELSRIGFTNVLGVMVGVEDWAASGRPVAAFQVAIAADLRERLAGEGAVQVLDVRDPLEWEAGHIPGSVHRYVPDLVDHPADVLDPDAPVWVVCRTGSRAAIAAGLLARHGIEPVLVASGGVPDLL